MYCVVAVRMWSLTSIDLDVQAEQAGLESASASTREERRTSYATWKTKQYVSFWFLLDSESRVQWSNCNFLAVHHFQTRWCSHCQRHHRVIKQRCCQVSFIKTVWILFETLGFFSHIWLVIVVWYGVHQLWSERNGADDIYVFFLQVSGLYSSCSHWLLSRISWEADWRKRSSWRARSCAGSHLWSYSSTAEIAAQLRCSKSLVSHICLQKFKHEYFVPGLLSQRVSIRRHVTGLCCLQGYTTLQLTCSLEMHNIGFAWKTLKEQLGEQIETHIHRMTFLKSKTVCDACLILN